jgi:hypothetical protein
VKSRVFRGRLALAECLGAPPDRPPLHVPGTPGTDTTSPASEPTDPPSRPQE